MKALRIMGLAVAGLVLGAVLGFAAVFGIVLLLPREHFGEFQGLAAIDYALVGGAPGGALLFCALGVWLGCRLNRRAMDQSGGA